ncbi:MAG: patatin-like phospholipase family protein [Solirubrobacteraceae bacterium]
MSRMTNRATTRRPGARRARRETDAQAGNGVAVVLSGGGARGAYEAGVLSVLVPALEARGETPTMFVGSSVGAINAAGLAGFWHLGPAAATEAGLDIWRSVDKDKVIRPILAWQVPMTAMRYAGGLLSLPHMRVPSLLDPTPLRDNLARWIDWTMLHRNVRDGTVGAVAVVATATARGHTVVFAEGSRERVEALRQGRSHAVSYAPVKLAPEHIRASAAIPIFFPPVHVHSPRSAAGWYIDGGTRLNTPLKPALDLGAQRIIVVGMDCVSDQQLPVSRPADSGPPDFGDGALHVLQGRLVDPMIEDVRMLGNVNLYFAGGDRRADEYRAARGKDPYRVVPYMFIAPSQRGAIGKLAAEVFKQNYGSLLGIRQLRRGLASQAFHGTDFRLLNRLIGSESPSHGELLSYLFFDRDFIESLITMGKEDAEHWLADDPGPTEPWQVKPLERFVRPMA